MAYIPPHMRHSKGPKRPTPTPEVLVPQFNRNLNLRSPKPNVDRSGKIVYAERAISRWCVAGLDGNNQFPSTVQLEPFPLESFERKGVKPVVLMKGPLAKDDDGDDDDVKGNISKTSWESIAQDAWHDLLSSFEIVRKEMECQELEVKPGLAARFGKILFYGSPSMSAESLRKGAVTEDSLRQLKRLFYTNVPISCMETIISGVVPKIGVDFEEEKDTFYVKLSDNTQPNSTISCKCSINQDKKLELYKVELHPLRHMIVDVSCLDKNLDLRLALYTKPILTALTDDEMQSIKNLINSAVLDSEVKGGLRWPIGKARSGERYSVIGVWHTISKIYKSSSLRLKLRHADRFDFKTSTGDATIEVKLTLKGLVSQIQEGKIENDSMYNIFKENIKLIWDHFLCCEQFLT